MADKEKKTVVDTEWFDEQLRITKITLRAIARRGGFNVSCLSRVIRGKTPLNLSLAIILADTFDVPIEEIIKRCGIPKPPRKDDKTLKTIAAAHKSRARIAALRRSDSLVTKHASLRKRTIEDMQELANCWGGKCLSKTYLKKPAKLTWQCKEGHQWEATPHNIQKGSWCPTCAGHTKGNIEEMQKLAAKHSGKCLSNHYHNARIMLTWQCREGHQWAAKPIRIKQGHWCPTCAAAYKS